MLELNTKFIASHSNIEIDVYIGFYLTKLYILIFKLILIS